VHDHEPRNLPPGTESTVARDAADLRRATRASAALITKVSTSAAQQCPADLPPAVAEYVTHSVMRSTVGVAERVQDLRIAGLALRPACPVDDEPEGSLPWLDLRVVAVLQHLDPLDGAAGEGRSDLLLDAATLRFFHAISPQLPIAHPLQIELSSAA
jgi:hypothetical protein